jgi:hypothetical protein
VRWFFFLYVFVPDKVFGPGYDVQQLFYVNDLGAQIGLTALGYSRVYDQLKPGLKIDQWIGVMMAMIFHCFVFVCSPMRIVSGMMYAVMNTFSELQKLGLTLGTTPSHLLTSPSLTSLRSLSPDQVEKAVASGEKLTTASIAAAAAAPARTAEEETELAKGVRLEPPWFSLRALTPLWL